MVEFLIMFTLGILIGLLIKKKLNIGTVIEKLTNVSLYLLLLYLGLTVGLNKVIVSNLPKIGLKVVFISVFTILFSLICAAIIYKIFFKKDKALRKQNEE